MMNFRTDLALERRDFYIVKQIMWQMKLMVWETEEGAIRRND